MLQGERVREIRKALGLTLEEFGKKIGMKKNSISQIENGKNALTDQTMKSICREYNVSLDWLCSESGRMFLSESVDEKYKRAANTIASGTEDMDRIVRQLLIYYFEMDDDSKKVLMGHLRALASMIPPEARQHSKAPSHEELEKSCPPISEKDVG